MFLVTCYALIIQNHIIFGCLFVMLFWNYLIVLKAPLAKMSEDMIAMLMGSEMKKLFFSNGAYFVEGETDKRLLLALRHFTFCLAKQTNAEANCNLGASPDKVYSSKREIYDFVNLIYRSFNKTY